MATQAQLDAFNSAIAAGDIAQATSIAESAGYTAGQVGEYVSANPGLVGSAVGGVGNVTTSPVSDPVAVNLLNQFDAAMLQRDFATASNLINQAANIYGPDTYANMAQYLGIQNQPGAFTPQALQAAGNTFIPKPPPLPVMPPPAAAGASTIDPLIAPYLNEALQRSRSLFLGTGGPQLFPGQMYVEPSAQTEAALTQMEQLAGLSQPYFMQAQEGLTQGMRGLQETATGGFLQGSPYRDQLIEAATRPITQQFTEQVMPGIQSTFSQAGRLGSGAQAAVTGRATEAFGRAVGDVTSQIAAQDYARERSFQEQAQRDVINAAGQFGGVFSSFLAPAQTLAQVGAQREAIAAQPLQESIRRFEYAQQLPYQQLGGYLSSIYGSPLASQNAPTQQQQGNSLLQDIGSVVNIAGTLGKFGQSDLGKSTFNFLGIPGFQIS